jgi:hypothetical protein
MAKNSVGKRAESIKDLLADVRAYCPEILRPSIELMSAVNRAAKYFNLDMNKREESDLLLGILAVLVFPNVGRKKGSAQWNSLRLSQLGGHWREIERANPGISDSKAAVQIKKRYPKHYQSADSIRPRLPDARLMIGVGKASEEDPHAMVKEAVRSVDLLLVDWENFEEWPKEKRKVFLKKFPSLYSRLNKFIDTLNRYKDICKEEAAKLAEREKRSQISTAVK